MAFLLWHRIYHARLFSLIYLRKFCVGSVQIVNSILFYFVGGAQLSTTPPPPEDAQGTAIVACLQAVSRDLKSWVQGMDDSTLF